MAETKSGPAGGGTPVSPGLTAGLERLMDDSINPGIDRASICVEFLTRAADDVAQAKRVRDNYARLARRYGLTNQAIGDALGVTEARVRQIVAGGA